VSRAAFRKAERCFALARSTTFQGERDSAVARGTEIATKAGIDLDLFDIPGRKRVRRAPHSNPLFEGSGIFGDGYSYANPWGAVSADEIMSQIDEMLRRAGRQQHDLAAERQRRRVESAVRFLRGRGCTVKEFSDETFTVDEHHSPGARVSAEVVIMAAQSRGWRS
jgi:hypothetical protein